jgi:hypothetical protein
VRVQQKGNDGLQNKKSERQVHADQRTNHKQGRLKVFFCWRHAQKFKYYLKRASKND